MSLASIIIPAYNASKYIAETVQSVVNQTYSNWELIIVDDGSTDNTLKIIDAIAQTDSRIKYLTKNNSGVSDTRNKGLSIAKGEFISFLDADDIWHTNNLEEKIKFIQKDNIDVAYSNCEKIDRNSNSLNNILTGSETPLLSDILLLRGNYLTAPSGIVLKKNVLDKIGGFDTNLSNNADQDLWIRILSNNFKIKLIKLVLWKYRVHDNNMSSNIALLEKDSIYIFNKAKKNNLYDTFAFKQKAFSKLNLMLAGSWWKNGNNKTRGAYFIFKALINYPFILINND